MASELFSSLQQGLRDFKNNHDIDMSHPNGSVVYGKPYPSTHKTVWMNVNHAKNSSNSFSYQFIIPLENGHRVHTIKHDREGMAIRSRIEIPTKYMFRQPNGENYISNTYRTMQINGNESGIPEHHKELMAGVNDIHLHENKDMFHDYLKSVSRLPRFGTTEQHNELNRRDSKPTFESHRAMTDDELHEHFKNTNLREAEHPHNIHLYVNDDNDRRILQYDYNTKTEQLTTDEEWD